MTRLCKWLRTWRVQVAMYDESNQLIWRRVVIPTIIVYYFVAVIIWAAACWICHTPQR